MGSLPCFMTSFVSSFLRSLDETWRATCRCRREQKHWSFLSRLFKRKKPNLCFLSRLQSRKFMRLNTMEWQQLLYLLLMSIDISITTHEELFFTTERHWHRLSRDTHETSKGRKETRGKKNTVRVTAFSSQDTSSGLFFSHVNRVNDLTACNWMRCSLFLSRRRSPDSRLTTILFTTSPRVLKTLV